MEKGLQIHRANFLSMIILNSINMFPLVLRYFTALFMVIVFTVVVLYGNLILLVQITGLIPCGTDIVIEITELIP